MKILTDLEIKQILYLHNLWKKHKKGRKYHHSDDYKGFLTQKEREKIIDKIFGILFKT